MLAPTSQEQSQRDRLERLRELAKLWAPLQDEFLGKVADDSEERRRATARSLADVMQQAAGVPQQTSPFQAGGDLFARQLAATRMRAKAATMADDAMDKSTAAKKLAVSKYASALRRQALSGGQASVGLANAILSGQMDAAAIKDAGNANMWGSIIGGVGSLAMKGVSNKQQGLSFFGKQQTFSTPAFTPDPSIGNWNFVTPGVGASSSFIQPGGSLLPNTSWGGTSGWL